MKIYQYPERDKWESLCARPQIAPETLFPAVREIMDRVREQGDAALIKYTKDFDGVALDEIRCSDKEIAAAADKVPEDLKAAIRLAADHIRIFHKSQDKSENPVETAPGVCCWREARPISKVGLYIPGGSAPLFSTVLMLGIPALLAGCSEIVLCSPPQPDGSLHPAILWTAAEIGISQIYKLGGAQAIAAMIYGTQSVQAVYKIFGPGNQYVTAAKLLAAQESVAIDMPAGPSEVLVIADDSADPEFVAADLLSQAEHGPDSQVILLTTDPKLPEKVLAEIESQRRELPRSGIARKSLEHAKIIVFKSPDDCLDFSDIYAPEHLILQLREPEAAASKVQNAGSVFMGELTPESAGDYASGTNHTLPTNGFAKNYSGVSLNDFRKMLTFQTLDPEGLRQIGSAVETMAKAEALEAHARAMRIRLQKIKEYKR